MKIRTLSVALTLGLAVGLAALLLLSGPVWAGDEAGEGRTGAVLFNGRDTAPVLQSIDPLSNTHTAPLTASVSITYDQPMSLTHVTTATFAVHAMQTGLLSQTYGVKDGTIALTPTNAFKAGELVQVSATTGTLNYTGTEPAAPTVWAFRAETLSGSGQFLVANDVGPGDDNTRAAALGDVDGDGNLDLVVGNLQQQNVVYLGMGDGTFETTGHSFGSSDAQTYGLALGDLDGDGDLDIAVANAGTNKIYLNDGDGTFDTTSNSAGGGNSWDVALGDMDGDGDLDAVVANRTQQNVIYFNNGHGEFANPHSFGTASPFRSASVALGDLDGDGDLDVVIGDNYSYRVFLNLGDGTLDAGSGSNVGGYDAYAVALGDLDGDGDLDLVLGHLNAPNQIRLNDGDPTFHYSSPPSHTFGYDSDDTQSIDLGDVDGDGDLDIVEGNGYQNKVYLNDGDGSVDTTAYDLGPGDDPTNDVVLGDVDGDGDLDAAVSNADGQNAVFLNLGGADLVIDKSVTPLVVGPGKTVTYTLTFLNRGAMAATGVVITDRVPASFGNWTVAGSSGATITPKAGQPFAWTVEDLDPGEGGVITLTGTAPDVACASVVNTATIAMADAEEWQPNNEAVVASGVNVPLYVEGIDAGAGLAVNGAAVVTGTTVCLEPGQTVTLTTSFGGQEYEDVVEAHYPLDVAVHARSYAASPGMVYLDDDLNYTPYDIFVITSDDGSQAFEFDMDSPPADEAVKIIGLHAMVPGAEIGELGDSDHTGGPAGLVEVFYGTVEGGSELTIKTTCEDEMGSAFNKVVADDVLFDSGCSDEVDVMIQELYAGRVESDDTEISWWRMVLTGQFYVDDYDGYSLNDELPELASLEEDGMLWFKARNPAKWGLAPLIEIEGQGYAKAWEFDNYDYEDYNFWEMHLGGDFYWTNDDDSTEYAHFLGPVMEMDTFYWEPESDLYLNFFGDNTDNYEEAERFDGDDGSAGADFWKPLLTTEYGYTEDAEGNIVSPIFVWRLREGLFDAGYESTYLYLADDQDLLILSDSDGLEFRDDGDGIYYEEGPGSHWVVEDGLTYTDSVPTDDAFNITVVDFVTRTGLAPALVVTASNDYDPGSSVSSAGDDAASTMYLAYREVGAYGQQLVKAPMSYSAVSGQWSAEVALEEGVYDFYIVATENDDVYGKVVERQGVRIVGETPDPVVLISPADGTLTTTNELTLTWRAGGKGDVAGYKVDFGGTVIDVGDVTEYGTGLLADGVYTWTVALMMPRAPGPTPKPGSSRWMPHSR